MKSAPVLVIANDELAAALLAALIEAYEYRPVFPRAGESPRDALRRERPAAVVMHCADEATCSEALLGPATMLGSTAIVVGTRRDASRLAELRRRFEVRTAVLAPDSDELPVALRDLAPQRSEGPSISPDVARRSPAP